MKLIRKFSNWLDKDKSFTKTYGIIYVLIFLIFSLVYLNCIFNLDWTEDYKLLSNAMEENRSNVEQLLTQYDYSSINTKENYYINCSKEKVRVTSNKSYFLIGKPEINYSVAKNNDSFVISDTYTKTEHKKLDAIMLFFLILIFGDLVLALILLYLLMVLLDFVIYVDGKIKSKKKKD